MNRNLRAIIELSLAGALAVSAGCESSKFYNCEIRKRTITTIVSQKTNIVEILEGYKDGNLIWQRTNNNPGVIFPRSTRETKSLTVPSFYKPRDYYNL